MKGWIVGVAGVLAVGCADITEPSVDPSGLAAAAAVESHERSLLPLAGMPWAFAEAISDDGTVVGWIRTESGEMRAARWSQGELTVLEDFGGSSAASDVNARGEIVGYAIDDGHLRAVVWRDGVLTDLGTLGGTFAFALGINGLGEIVGGSETASGDVNAFVWTKGGMIDLGRLPGATFAQAEDLNERGEIVGWSAGGSYLQAATYWRRGRISELPSLGREAAALAINTRGEIVGGSIRDLSAHGVLWRRGAIRDLGAIDGQYSTAHGINSRGQVVGTTSAPGCAQCPFFWDDGVMGLLDTDGVGGTAADINSGSDVTGMIGSAGGPRPAIWSAGGTPWAQSSPRGRLPAAARTGRNVRSAITVAAICDARPRVDSGNAPLLVLAGC